MNNILLGNIKVGDVVTYCFRKVEVSKIQKGYPISLVIGYDEYGTRVKIPFNK